MSASAWARKTRSSAAGTCSSVPLSSVSSRRAIISASRGSPRHSAIRAWVPSKLTNILGAKGQRARTSQQGRRTTCGIIESTRADVHHAPHVLQHPFLDRYASASRSATTVFTSEGRPRPIMASLMLDRTMLVTHVSAGPIWSKRSRSAMPIGRTSSSWLSFRIRRAVPARPGPGEVIVARPGRSGSLAPAERCPLESAGSGGLSRALRVIRRYCPKIETHQLEPSEERGSERLPGNRCRGHEQQPRGRTRPRPRYRQQVRRSGTCGSRKLSSRTSTSGRVGSSSTARSSSCPSSTRSSPSPIASLVDQLLRPWVHPRQRVA